MKETNLSKQKRDKLIEICEKLKETNIDSTADINEIISFIKSRKYGLVFEEHEEEINQLLKDNIPIFKEIKEKEIVSDKNLDYNFLLEGDNLHSLKLLEKTHKGKIDVIYIDPPYNTGNNDFVYADKMVGQDDGYKHSKWLSFMKERLEIAYNLLKNNGLIFISIDDNEFANLKLLCDDVFGEENMLSTHHIQVRYAEKTFLDKSIAPVMEYVLIYIKDIKQIKLNLPKEEYTDENFIYKITELNNGTSITHENGQEIKIFKDGEWKIEKVLANINALKETWVSGTIYTKLSYGQVVKKYIEPRYKLDGLNCLYKVIGKGEDGLGYRYYVGPQKKNANRCKMYSGMPLDKVNEIKNGGAYKNVPIPNYYNYSPDFGNIKHEGGVGFNSGKKPIKMLKEFINYHTNKNAIVLDFFAGSGTTGHAVLELNKEDGGNRKFILCTNNEVNSKKEIEYMNSKFGAKPSFTKEQIKRLTDNEKEAYEKSIIDWNNKLEQFKSTTEYEELGICQSITYQRLKTVITGKRQDGTEYSQGLPANLKYYKADFISKDVTNLNDKILEYVKEMIQLENAIDINNESCLLLLLNKDKEGLEEKLKETNAKFLYKSNSILLNNEVKRICNEKGITIINIPDYYFKNELEEWQW